MTTLKEELSKEVYENMTFDEMLTAIQNLPEVPVDSYKIKSGKAGAYLASEAGNYAWSVLRKIQHAFLNDLPYGGKQVPNNLFALVDQTIATVKKDDGFFDMKPETPVGDSNLAGLDALVGLGIVPSKEAFLDLGRRMEKQFSGVTKDQIIRTVLDLDEPMAPKVVRYPSNLHNNIVRITDRRIQISVRLDKAAPVDIPISVDIYEYDEDSKLYSKRPFATIVVPKGEIMATREFTGRTAIKFQVSGTSKINVPYEMAVKLGD